MVTRSEWKMIHTWGHGGAWYGMKNQWHHDLLAFYRQLISLRRQLSTLQTGGFQVLRVEKDTFAYLRADENGFALVVAHRNETPYPAGHFPVALGGIADGTSLREFFTGQTIDVVDGQLALPVLGQGATLWLGER